MIVRAIAGNDDSPPSTIEVRSESTLLTFVGEFNAIRFALGAASTTHVALVRGDVAADDVLTRVHSECLTGDVFGSRRCDCGEQLHTAMTVVARAQRGIVIYLRGHEGRGIGLFNKLRSYTLQDSGLDTVQANIALGLPVDARSYEGAVAILNHLGVRSVALLTNNPEKVGGVTRSGIVCNAVVPMPANVQGDNQRYLATKAKRMGHQGLLPSHALGQWAHG